MTDEGGRWSGAQIAGGLMLLNAAALLLVANQLPDTERYLAMWAGAFDIALGTCIALGWEVQNLFVFRVFVGVAGAVGLSLITRQWVPLLSLAPLVAVVLLLVLEAGRARMGATLLFELPWLALVLVSLYTARTGTYPFATENARLTGSVSRETITEVEGPRDAYRVRFPPGSWRRVTQLQGADPPDVEVRDPSHRARLEVRVIHAPGAGGFDLEKVAASLTRGQAEDSTDLTPGVFDRGRIFRIPLSDNGQPAWVGLYARGDRAFTVIGEAPADRFQQLSPQLREIVASFQYEPPSFPALPTEVAEHVRRATVLVQTQRSAGSGFVLGFDEERAWVMTNHHVIAASPSPRSQRPTEPAPQRTVSVAFTDASDPTPKDAEVIASDAKLDLALIEVPVRHGLVRLKLRAAPVPKGRPVFSSGYPLGPSLGIGPYPSPTMNTGRIAYEKGTAERQPIDLALNPGNSGGPVVDAAGAVVGVAVTTVLDTEVSHIVPAAQVLKFLGQRSWLAVLDGDPAEPEVPRFSDAARTRATEATVYIASASGGAAGVVIASSDASAKGLLLLAPRDAVPGPGSTLPVRFWPGTDRSRSVTARVVAGDSRLPLAVLSVPRFEGAPEPIPLGQAGTTVETSPVDVFGFVPGGAPGAELPVLRRSGSLTARQRDDAGEIWGLHVDVGVLRGLIPGPVIDLQGRLLGLVYDHPPDARNLAVALASERAEDLLGGGVKDGLVRVISDGMGRCLVRVDLELQDSLRHIKQLGLQRQARSDRVSALDWISVPFEGFGSMTAVQGDKVGVEGVVQHCPPGFLAWRLELRSERRTRYGAVHLASTVATTSGPHVSTLSGESPRGLLGQTASWTPLAAWTPECPPDDPARCQALCRRGRAGSCYLHALQIAATQPQQSDDLLLRACRQGVGPACTALVGAKLRDGVSPGYARLSAGPEPLIQLLGRGCSGAYGPACFLAARLAHGVAQADEERRFLDRGCRLDDADSCTAVAASKLELDDRPAALELLTRSCRNWSARACSQLARMLDEGFGAPTDHYKAFRLFGKACISGDGAACARYADFGLRQHVAWFDKSDAMMALQRGCELKHEDSCKSLKVVKTSLQQR